MRKIFLDFQDSENITKEEWLRRHGTEVSKATVKHFRFKDTLMLPVILICLGASNMAIICRNKSEVRFAERVYFGHPMMYFICHKDDLQKAQKFSVDDLGFKDKEETL